jgi:hypothetical protein
LNALVPTPALLNPSLAYIYGRKQRLRQSKRRRTARWPTPPRELRHGIRWSRCLAKFSRYRWTARRVFSRLVKFDLTRGRNNLFRSFHLNPYLSVSYVSGNIFRFPAVCTITDVSPERAGWLVSPCRAGSRADHDRPKIPESYFGLSLHRPTISPARAPYWPGVLLVLSTTTSPPFMTHFTLLSVTLMSESGSPSTATKSAR